jgi:hypothetical protein
VAGVVLERPHQGGHHAHHGGDEDGRQPHAVRGRPQAAQRGGDDAPPRTVMHVGEVGVNGPADAHLAQGHDDARASDEMQRVDHAPHTPQQPLFRGQDLVGRRGQGLVERRREDRRHVRHIVGRRCVRAGNTHGGRAFDVVRTRGGVPGTATISSSSSATTAGVWRLAVAVVAAPRRRGPAAGESVESVWEQRRHDGNATVEEVVHTHPLSRARAIDNSLS